MFTNRLFDICHNDGSICTSYIQSNQEKRLPDISSDLQEEEKQIIHALHFLDGTRIGYNFFFFKREQSLVVYRYLAVLVI